MANCRPSQTILTLINSSNADCNLWYQRTIEVRSAPGMSQPKFPPSALLRLGKRKMPHGDGSDVRKLDDEEEDQIQNFRRVEVIHQQFRKNEPRNLSFTERYPLPPLTLPTANRPSNLSNASQIHLIAAQQMSNRLPPITDVFTAEGPGAHRHGPAPFFLGLRNNGSTSNSSHSNSRPAFPSPKHNNNQAPQWARPREYRSAEDAQVELAGGRPELLPKLVHYGGHQPPRLPTSSVAIGPASDSSSDSDNEVDLQSTEQCQFRGSSSPSPSAREKRQRTSSYGLSTSVKDRD
jgi:hypothetical protein